MLHSKDPSTKKWPDIPNCYKLHVKRLLGSTFYSKCNGIFLQGDNQDPQWCE